MDRSFRWLQQTGHQLDQCCFPRAAASGESDHLAGADVEIDVTENVRRFRSTVFEANAAELNSSFQTRHRNQPRAIMSLLRFLLEDVIEPIEQHGCELQIVPNAQCFQNS